MERIRGLGTSWYTRGGKYWTLRVVAAFMMFLVLLFSTGMTVGFGYGLWRIGAPVWVRVLLLAVVFASIVRSSVKAWAAFIKVERGRRDGQLVTLAAAAGDAGSDRRVRRAGWAGGATGVLAAMGSGLRGVRRAGSPPAVVRRPWRAQPAHHLSTGSGGPGVRNPRATRQAHLCQTTSTATARPTLMTSMVKPNDAGCRYHGVGRSMETRPGPANINATVVAAAISSYS